MTRQRFPSLPAPVLRAARDEDFETLYAIDQVCYSAAIAYTREELHWYLGLRGAECVVAELRAHGKSSRSRIAGFVVSVRRNVHGHIVTIDVLEMYRRTGVGSALLECVEARMAQRGAAEVWLETATNNDAAIAFWKKHSYRSRGRLTNYYPDGLDAFAMSKSLARANFKEN